MLERALDGNGVLIAVEAAMAQKEYYCPHCNEPMRLKKGTIRKPHFFHIARTPECRLSEKTYLHALIQEKIYEMLPGKEKGLEHSFPEIARIADVVSFDLHAVFEVQISRITSREMHERQIDYKKAGLEIVWILHERRFKKMPYLIYYLTDIDDEGRGSIFDPLTGSVDITKALCLDAPLGPYPKGQIFFKGDRIWRALAGELVINKKPLKERYRLWLLRVFKGLLN